MLSEQKTLYERVGGYEAIYKFAEDVISRLMNDEEVGRIWDHMSQDRVLKEHQNFVDWLCEHWGGPMMYRGRDLETVHRGMRITERDWEIALRKLDESYNKFGVARELRKEINAFIQRFKPQIVGSPSFRQVVRGPDGQGFTVVWNLTAQNGQPAGSLRRSHPSRDHSWSRARVCLTWLWASLDDRSLIAGSTDSGMFMWIRSCKTGRVVFGIALAAFMIVALARSIPCAEPDSQSQARQAPDEFDDQFFRMSLEKLHGGATNSIGIDYTPEARCSDNNWSTKTPVACNPQLSFMCTGKNPLSTCPTSCQKCYNDDLENLKNSLGASTITSYQPNYYILTTAQNLKIKILQGLYNDAIPSLAAPDSATNCTFAGQPIALCGSKYAGALLDGACGTTTPWNPETFCGIAPNTGPYIEPLNYPNGPRGQFIKNGTIVAIQLGNEAIGMKENKQIITPQMISTAAQILRTALDARGFKHIPIVVSLVLGQESTFCTGGAPPAGVDFIAAHPYCDNVAGMPPSWPNNGTQCWQQVQTQFSSISQASCGPAHTFIGETGYNTGCPNSPNVPPGLVSEEQTFIASLKKSTCATSSESGFPTFLFAYSDVCPSTGCLPGCSEGLPDEGNGYFGIFHTQEYLTEGPAIAKFPPPSLVCPEAFRR